MKKLLCGLAMLVMASSANAKEPQLIEAPECEEVVWDRLCVGMTKKELERAYWRTDKDKSAYMSIFYNDWNLEWQNEGRTISRAERKFRFNVTQPMLVASLTEKYGEPYSVEAVTREDHDVNVFGVNFEGKGVHTARKWTWKNGNVTITTTGEDDEVIPKVIYYVVQPNAELNL